MFLIVVVLGGVAFANEDNLDDTVDVEGDDVNVVSEDEVEEEGLSKSSEEVNTTILFIEPVHPSLSSLGKLFKL